MRMFVVWILAWMFFGWQAPCFQNWSWAVVVLVSCYLLDLFDLFYIIVRMRVSVVTGGTMLMLMFVVIAMLMFMFVVMVMFMLMLVVVAVAMSVIMTMFIFVFMLMLMTVVVTMSMSVIAIMIMVSVIVTMRAGTIRSMRMWMLSMWLENAVNLINNTMSITTAHSKEGKVANIEDQTYEGSQEHYFWIKCKSFPPV